MDMKESFESWWLAKVEKEIGFPLEKGMELNYGNSEIDLAWSAWSASRESLVVDLGSMTNNGYEGFYPANQINRALRDSGIRTK